MPPQEWLERILDIPLLDIAAFRPTSANPVGDVKVLVIAG